MFSAFAAETDPVLMTIDRTPVYASEFEYLYNKNNTQQLQPQTLDEYLDMFINYKLKVADAIHEGLDRTPEFNTEYESFVNDLSKPYFTDESVSEAMVQEAYSHYGTDVLVSHIMLPLSLTSEAQLDSLRTLIVEGKANFEDIAKRYSVDRYSSGKGGLMGVVVPGRYPWPFEEAAYSTEPGHISPVINSGVGYHIIRVESIKPSEGEVKADHILIGIDEETPVEHAKAVADSLYTLAAAGADFGELARRFSQDPGSAQRGGNLGWFGRGRMVAPFDSAAFALAPGEISKPVRTNFGYHIIRANERRVKPSLAEARRNIEEGIKRDERANRPYRAVMNRLRDTYNVVSDPRTEAHAKAIIALAAPDSVKLGQLAALTTPVATYNGGSVSAADVVALIPASEFAANPTSAFNEATQTAIDNVVAKLYRIQLSTENTDFRNLLNEYHDGILLYEVSNRKVWDKAAKDTEGLENYFRTHREKYLWDQPKFKSYVIFAANDSVLDAAINFAGTLDASHPAEFTEAMRKQFGRSIKVERVVAAKGENAITDYLGFGAERPAGKSTDHWRSYKAFNGKVVDAPEEAADVRGAAVTDYQSLLDEQWVKDLHKKYKVKVNKKVFNAIKAKAQ